jgi:circadian clock protein KaiC
VFHPAEMELSETTKLIFEHVERINPTRVVLDSLSELRLLAQSPLRYRRQVLALKHFFTSRNCTVILLDDLSAQQDDLQLHSSRTAWCCWNNSPSSMEPSGDACASSRCAAARSGGIHDFTIERVASIIFPRLVASEHHKTFVGSSPQAATPSSTSSGGRTGARHERAPHREPPGWASPPLP